MLELCARFKQEPTIKGKLQCLLCICFQIIGFFFVCWMLCQMFFDIIFQRETLVDKLGGTLDLICLPIVLGAWLIVRKVGK
jgi:hypothetical protein